MPIAAELGCTQARVSQYIKRVAKNHPVNKLSLEEGMAVSEERWNRSEQEMREGIRLPNGQEQVKITKTEGVDPALLRALSTHHDRRARQLNNQLSPDAGVQAVQVNVVKDFLNQGDNSCKLNAEAWNQQVLDV